MNKINFSSRVLIICCLLGQIGLAQNAITDWAGIVAPAIMKVGSSTRPPASSEVLHATINLAVYNATMAIVGGYRAVRSAHCLIARRGCAGRGRHCRFSHGRSARGLVPGGIPAAAVRHLPSYLP